MPADSSIHIRERELGELRFNVSVVIGNAVETAVESVAEARALCLCQDVGEFRQEFTRRLERLLREAVANQFVVFVQRGAQREDAVIRLDRADPDLKNLLLTCNVRIRSHLKHSALQ